MSDMKCPICNKPMKQATYDYDKKDNDDTLYMSIMPCDCLCNFAASKAVWQELIRTRKELDVALDWLEQVATPAKCDDNLCREFTKRKLAEIKTALEQKE